MSPEEQDWEERPGKAVCAENTTVSVTVSEAKQ